jgi:hypothetical protein
VATQVRPMLPVLLGISGSWRTTWKRGRGTGQRSGTAFQAVSPWGLWAPRMSVRLRRAWKALRLMGWKPMPLGWGRTLGLRGFVLE